MTFTTKARFAWLLAAAFVLALGAGCSDDGDSREGDGSGDSGTTGRGDTGTGDMDTGNPMIDVSPSDVGGGTDTGGMDTTPTDTGGTDTGNTGGSDDCLTVIECIQGAGQDQQAINACLDSGTTAAQGQVQALLTCIQTNCADAMTQEEANECQQMFCATEIQACVDGSEQPTGSTGAYQSCAMEPCQTGMACGSFDGVNQFCFPECEGMMCEGFNGGTGVCAVAFEGAMTATHCLPTCASVADCPDTWTCDDTGQGVSVCSPPQ